jgi:N5-(cytidine 5'-diphosphoramidyl)-L-glutamine hydrolase
MPELRSIGITMREHVSGHGETGDRIAAGWGALLDTALPGVRWLPVPNLGVPRALEFVDAWGVDALILSGGEDIGTVPRRDQTEALLLDAFRARAWPVLAVCRGFQLLWTRLGGQLCAVDGHAGVRHPVQASAAVPEPLRSLLPTEANSYHRWAAAGSPSGVRVLASDHQGRAEAFDVPGEPTVAVMWHPEREPVPAVTDARLLQRLFRDGWQ